MSYHTIQFGDTAISYEIVRSERRKKTIEIIVNGSGVQVMAPSVTSDVKIEAIVRKKAAWILEHSTQAALKASPRRFASGETLPYLGRNLRMIVQNTDVRSVQVRFDHWRFHVEAPFDLIGPQRVEKIRRRFVAWYRARASERIPERVAHWLPQVEGETEPAGILIRDQKKRWASCAPDGTLRFNWRVMMLKPALIDLIVVHELAHLTIKGHSADFWRVVRDAMPDAQTRRQELREAGRYLPL